MICTNCQSSENEFPRFPEIFPDYPGWCGECIHQEADLQFKLKQAQGFFIKIKRLRERLEAGEISNEQFETYKSGL